MDMSQLMPTKWHPTKNKPCCPGKKKVKKQPWLDGTLNTEYRNEFIDKEVPYAKAAPKQEMTKSSGPFDGTTTYGGDFKHFQTARPQLMKPESQPYNGGEFQGDSTYKQTFVPKAVPYERFRPKHAAPHTGGEFLGTTTYGGDFVPMGVPVPAKMMIRSNNMEKTGPFQGESNYKANFVKMPPAKRDPILARKGGEIMPKGAFDDGTTYRTGFVPKECGVPAQFRPQDAGALNTGDFEGNTEYRNQFIDKEVPVVKAVRPDRGGDVLPKGPLDGNTTYGGDFKLFQTAPAKSMKPSNEAKEQLPFNGASTYADSFIPKAVPYARVRPQNAFEPNKAQFDGSTTHKAAFQPMAVVPAAKYGPSRTVREALPFEGVSSYKDDFRKLPGAPSKTAKPASDRVKSGPFDGTTTYRTDFVEKEIPIRDDCTECSSCAEDEDEY